MKTLIAALFLLTVTPALAQESAGPGGSVRLADAAGGSRGSDPAAEIVSPEEFREYAEGHTLYFERNGQPFGSESFDAGGHTRWRYTDGSCVRGVWRPYGAQLCFLYDAAAEQGPLCWRMLRDEKGLFARLLDGAQAGMEIRITRRDKAPLLCGAPGRGT